MQWTARRALAPLLVGACAALRPPWGRQADVQAYLALRGGSSREGEGGDGARKPLPCGAPDCVRGDGVQLDEAAKAHPELAQLLGLMRDLQSRVDKLNATAAEPNEPVIVDPEVLAVPPSLRRAPRAYHGGDIAQVGALVRVRPDVTVPKHRWGHGAHPPDDP